MKTFKNELAYYDHVRKILAAQRNTVRLFVFVNMATGGKSFWQDRWLVEWPDYDRPYRAFDMDKALMSAAQRLKAVPEMYKLKDGEPALVSGARERVLGIMLGPALAEHVRVVAKREKK